MPRVMCLSWFFALIRVCPRVSAANLSIEWLPSRTGFCSLTAVRGWYHAPRIVSHFRTPTGIRNRLCIVLSFARKHQLSESENETTKSSPPLDRAFGFHGRGGCLLFGLPEHEFSCTREDAVTCSNRLCERLCAGSRRFDQTTAGHDS